MISASWCLVDKGLPLSLIKSEFPVHRYHVLSTQLWAAGTYIWTSSIRFPVGVALRATPHLGVANGLGPTFHSCTLQMAWDQRFKAGFPPGVKRHACDIFLLSSELPCGINWKTIQFKQ